MPAFEIAKTLDSRIADGVLVFGSLPPEGRDLDLLARPPEESVIADILAANGFLQRGAQWACFRGRSAFVVELVRADRWHLPAHELAALFAEAHPASGLKWLLEPAPHHKLLIAARRHARGKGGLQDRLRERIDDALSRDPRAWTIARERAPLWRATAALTLLQDRYDERDRGRRFARLRAWGELGLAAAARPDGPAMVGRQLRRRVDRRPRIVAFSGLDGAGKSSQARCLHQSLTRLGVASEVFWPPSKNVLFRMNPALNQALRSVFARVGRSAAEMSRFATEVPDAAAEEPGTEERSTKPQPGEPEVAPLPRQWGPVAHVLATIIALSQALALRRRATAGPRVVIYDRYTLDAIVYLQDRAYLRDRRGRPRPLRWQKWLIRSLSRRPANAYLLDIEPEDAFARKQEDPLENLRYRTALYREQYAQLGVKRLDAARSMDELCEEIARDVWLGPIGEIVA